LGNLTDQIVAVLLVSLRIAPLLAFAHPFTLLRVPAMVRRRRPAGPGYPWYSLPSGNRAVTFNSK